MRHVVHFSGGINSWAAAKRVTEEHGISDVTLLFADTNMEDEDLYRFLDDASANLCLEVTRIADGRTPWEVMRDEKIIANSRIDPCSKLLKRRLLDKWNRDNCEPGDSVHYLGIDWTETHRLERMQQHCAPWHYEAPLCDPPYLSKADILYWAKSEGLKPPRLYEMGFPHNNCGGFCVKAGQAQFALLLRTMPERYAYHEAQEEKMRKVVGNHSILRRRFNGFSEPLSLKEFRKQIEKQGTFDEYEWGGCGCAID